ncbi:MAG: hypothetical protein C0599_02240 [Salinivirgaceae bacterium]|nr:MAG: hypothetical protein C0599_02240 [Salinivirgaceae bacterium]
MKQKTVSNIKKIIKILLWLILATSIVGFVNIFYQPETQFGQYTIVNPFYEYVKEMPFWTYMIMYFTAFSMFSVFFFISLSFYFNIQRNRTSKTTEHYLSFFSYVLTNYYLSKTYQDEKFQDCLFNKLKPYVKKRIQLEALLRSYTRIQETLAMDLSGKSKRLLEKLNAFHKIEKLLLDDDFEKRILAMKVLSYLRITDYEEQMIKYSENKNFALRTEAYAALIRLMKSDEHLVSFIGNKHQLSVLDVNIIVNAVLKNFKLDIDYIGLLSSENPRKIMVGLLLAKYRYRKSSKNLILILNHIGNEDEMLNKLAWEALITLVPDDEVIDIVIDRFHQEPYDVKLFILQSLHTSKSTRFYEFLTKVIESQPLLLKIEAMKILFENDYELLSSFANSKNYNIQKAYKETVCVFIS